MFVAKRMTKNPITVSSNTAIDKVVSIFRKHKFHRMPVVDKGRLVGVFSDRDIARIMPSPATTLSRFEINDLLGKMMVRDIMQKNVITVPEDATVEEAALIMYNHKIGGLPVVSSVGTVVGVITSTDILKTFVDVMGLTEGRTRFTIKTGDKLGVVRDISSVFADNNLNIDSLVTCKQDDGTYEIVVRGIIDDEAVLKDKLAAKGYNVVHTVKIG